MLPLKSMIYRGRKTRHYLRFVAPTVLLTDLNSNSALSLEIKIVSFFKYSIPFRCVFTSLLAFSSVYDLGEAHLLPNMLYAFKVMNSVASIPYHICQSLPTSRRHTCTIYLVNRTFHGRSTAFHCRLDTTIL